MAIKNQTAGTWDLTLSGNEGYQTLEIPILTTYFTDHNLPLLIRAQLNQAGSTSTNYVQIVEIDLFAANYTPVIMYPLNGSTVNTTYPPLETDIDFSWYDVKSGIDYWEYDIAADENYNLIKHSATTTTNTTSIALESGDYWFRVRGYSDDDGYSNYAETQFTINTTTTDYDTAVQGVVYKNEAGSQTPLAGANVVLYNDTYSDTYTTSSNGFYLFDNINNGTYYIQASKDGYEDSTLNIVTLSDGVTSTKNIVLEPETAPNYIMPHYVRFVVRSLFGGVYEGVTVKVYEGDSATAQFTETTGSDGAVGFELSESVRYRLTLYSETDNIDTVYRVTPTKDSYNIYVSLTGSSQAQQEADVILYGMHTDGNELNVTWNDTSGLTTLAEITVKNRDGSTAYYLNSTSSNSYVTQEVNTTANSTYIVELNIESGGLSETFTRSHIITFDEGVKPEFDLGFSAEWQSMFLAALSIIFLAVLFGSANAHLGAILVAVAGLFHVFITGWIPTTVLTVAMMFIALLVSVAFYMRKGEAVK